MHVIPAPIAIITPCYNEGDVVIHFLQQLQEVLAQQPHHFQVLVIDDCSTDDTGALLRAFRFNVSNCSLSILQLSENSGHQAAILAGLTHARNGSPEYCIIMDADGQDNPSLIPLLLQNRCSDVVHVSRGTRSESVLFRAGYALYKTLFRAVTGQRMHYGNYCLISRHVMEAAIETGFRHLPAYLARQKVKRVFLCAPRAPRLGGKSKMNLGRLVRHGLRSIGEYWRNEPVRQLPKMQ